MKPLPFKIPRGSKASIKVDHEVLDHFYPYYHTHEEVQLTLIIHGSGTAYIGDRIISFYEGDIFLIGQQLPHVFKDDIREKKSGIESISIFFLPEFLGPHFLDIPEAKDISVLIAESLRGVRINSSQELGINQKIIKILEMDGISRIMHLLKVLEEIAHSNTIEFITGPDYHKPRRQSDGQKINEVFNFLIEHYHHDIRLAEVADVANMSPTSFCRYFKQHTRKSYSTFLNELRIGQACKLLIENADPVNQIAFATGFNNISNFNRQFKKIVGITPSAYQNLRL